MATVIMETEPAKTKQAKVKKPRFVRPDLRYSIGSEGIKIYEKKASQIGKAAFKTLIKQANERLRQIEKRGLQDESKEYQLVKYYATQKSATKGAIYNVSKDGRIRFSSDLQKYMNEGKGFQTAAQRRAYFINTLRNFLTAESSTVSGIKAIKKRAYETFKKNIEASGGKTKGMTQQKYFDFWRMYRENFSDSKKDKFGYNTMMTLLKNSNIMALSPETINEVMAYAESSRDESRGFVDQVEDMFPDLKISI